jgi:hypothetical protein
MPLRKYILPASLGALVQEYRASPEFDRWRPAPKSDTSLRWADCHRYIGCGLMKSGAGILSPCAISTARRQAPRI